MSSMVSTLFSIFARPRKQTSLEVDAVPVSSNRSRSQNQKENDIISSNSYSTTQMRNNNEYLTNTRTNINYTNPNSNNFEIGTSSSIVDCTDLNGSLALSSNSNISNYNNTDNSLVDTNLINSTNSNQISPITTNNSLEINNTRGHTYYQFSNVNGLHIGHVFNYQSNADNHINKTINKNYNQSSSLLSPQTNKPQQPPKTRTIQKMIESKEPLDQNMINVISTHLGEGWKDVMRKLNYSEGQIHQADVDYSIEGLKEVIYQLLLEWSRNDDNANLGEITTILWKSGHRDVVYYMKQSWKESSNNNIESEI